MRPPVKLAPAGDVYGRGRKGTLQDRGAERAPFRTGVRIRYTDTSSRGRRPQTLREPVALGTGQDVEVERRRRR